MRRTLVLGIGGAGIQSLNQISEEDIGLDFVALSTDNQELQKTKISKKFLFGKSLTQGLGAGAQVKIGREAALVDFAEIGRLLQGYHSIVLIAGMGGGTGTGAAPVVAEIAKSQNIQVIGIVTRPFHFEGARRRRNAEEGIEKLGDICDSLFVISNQDLIDFSSQTRSLKDSFELVDQFIAKMVQKRVSLFRKRAIFELQKEDILSVLSEEPIATKTPPIALVAYQEFSEELLERIENLTIEILGGLDKEQFRWKMANQGDPCIITAEQNGLIIGFKAGYRRNSTKYYSWLGGVLPDYRNKGVASALMREQHNWCKKAGYKEVETQTMNKWKDMLILNLKSGFDIEGIKISKEFGEKIILVKQL